MIAAIVRAPHSVRPVTETVRARRATRETAVEDALAHHRIAPTADLIIGDARHQEALTRGFLVVMMEGMDTQLLNL